jgi:mono/diheme cytochrome c family protein
MSALKACRTVRPLFLLALLVALAVPAAAQATTTTVSGGDTAQIQRGYDVFTANCAGCHQAGGVGIEGTFPPLKDNPNLTDPEYIRTTVKNGKQGELVVNGVTYNGVMPAFSAIPDEDVDAVIAYIQGGFVVPNAGGGGTETTLPIATGTLPDLSGMAAAAAIAIFIAAAIFVLSPRIVSTNDRLTTPWLDAWLRTAIIVVFFVLTVAIIPSMVLKMETVGRLPQAVQDVIGLALWGGGLATGLWALWYAHREGRI